MIDVMKTPAKHVEPTHMHRLAQQVLIQLVADYTTLCKRGVVRQGRRLRALQYRERVGGVEMQDNDVTNLLEMIHDDALLDALFEACKLGGVHPSRFRANVYANERDARYEKGIYSLLRQTRSALSSEGFMERKAPPPLSTRRAPAMVQQ